MFPDHIASTKRARLFCINSMTTMFTFPIFLEFGVYLINVIPQMVLRNHDSMIYGISQQTHLFDGEGGF
jgi:hypothetical protein